MPVDPRLEQIAIAKRELAFPIIDTHFHPLDVMGVVPPQRRDALSDKTAVPPPGLLEYFGYDRIAKVGTQAAFAIAPGFIRRTIKQTFEGYGAETLRREAKASLIDQICLMPISPFVTTDEVGRMYQGDSFNVLGSFDVHRTKPEDVAPTLDRWIHDYKIVGIKLHPNLQSFYPQPSHNPPNVRDTLESIYREAERRALYLHFHAGKSFYTSQIHAIYGTVPRSHDKGVFPNFFSSDGSSELFGKYRIPILIAHLACYGTFELPSDLMRQAVELHPLLYFDTSGAPRRLISQALSGVGPDHIVFGSDGAYNRMAYNVSLLWQAIQDSALPDKQHALSKIMGMNYVSYINSKG